jgi:hypothetical protein
MTQAKSLLGRVIAEPADPRPTPTEVQAFLMLPLHPHWQHTDPRKDDDA